MAFHEVQFPTDISINSQSGPERRTEIVTLGSGYEERNQRWADARRKYNAGYGAKSIDDLHTIIEFFEERRGMLHGFRWKDGTDYKSVAPQSTVSMTDVTLGTGDGAETEFQIIKIYGVTYAPYTRNITKPVSGTVLVSVNDVLQTEGGGNDYTINYTTGVITFNSAPTSGHDVKAGFEFDVPVRFDTDRLRIDVAGFKHGSIPDVPVIEIKV